MDAAHRHRQNPSDQVPPNLMDQDSPDNPSATKRWQFPWRRYAAGLAVVAVAIVIRYFAHSWLGNAGFFLFWTASLVASWVGGFGPAFLTQTIIIAAEAWWFSQQKDPPFPSTLTDFAILVSFYAVGCTIGRMSDLRRAAQRRAIEEHRQAISQRERLDATLSCMADGVLVADLKGRVTLMNPAAEEMTGWTMAEAGGKALWEIFSVRREDTSQPVTIQIERVLKEGEKIRDASPLILMPRIGNPIPVAYSAAPIRDPHNGITSIVLIFRDESERHRSELALRNADKRKDEFLATLAHELRNPLAPICTGLELLDITSDDPQAASELRGMLIRQSRHMVRLIDDLLDVSRITRGKLELRKSHVDLAEIIRNAVETTQPLVESGGQHLVIKLPKRPIRLYADTNRLTQVFSNLLNNAVKFTPAEGRIELTAAQEGSKVTIDVADTGIGMPPDQLDEIFEMFTQVHGSSERVQSGLGIGLTLVRRLVELHDGEIEAYSAGENLGSKFSVRLPVLPAPEISEKPGTRAGEAVQRTAIRRVLVVDDNVDALESLSRLVACMGNDVRKAHDGLEAVESAESFRPDIVLMDLGMPRLDGYEAAKRMRQEPWGRALTLVATTGWGQDEHRRRAREAGFDHHLIKPIDIASLRSILHAPRLS